MLVLSCFGQHNFGFFPTSITLNENQGSAATIFGTINNAPFPASKSLRCKIIDYQNFPPQLQFNNRGGRFVITNSIGAFVWESPFGKFNLGYKYNNDGMCDDKRITVETVCYGNSDVNSPPLNITNPILTIDIINTESAGVCDDPHLTQKVNGKDENGKQVTKNIAMICLVSLVIKLS